MKVRFLATYELDPDLWAEVRGCGRDERSVREDVRWFLRAVLRDCPILPEGVRLTGIKNR